MRHTVLIAIGLWVGLAGVLTSCQRPHGAEQRMRAESPVERDTRMAWWRGARFGLFIHWGLYAVPAGEWNEQSGHGEWIRETAQIPIETYDRFVGQFNPVGFDADEWVRIAKDAGLRYVVITSKHHDGFCLFDSQFTDYDVMSTPFHRDVLKELAGACQRGGLRLCFYHSIMDWHHPDYLPRRSWEQRSAEGADYERYVAHLKNQLRELCQKYGSIGVLWFDGEWEGTWTHERGVDLYNYVRELRPDIIINNRVDTGRGGMAGMTKDSRFAGDYGTPEQEVPATGFPGVDWETCMTMNDHWGYNRLDHNWKSSAALIRMLVDIASKGGNFLLNVGPTAAGVFPPESVDRLRDMGRWMRVNGEAIYDTQGSPLPALSWGRCTQKPLGSGKTRLYLHVFDWPQDGRLVVPGLLNEPQRAYLLAAGDRPVRTVKREGDALVIAVPAEAPDSVTSVVVLDIAGRPDVGRPPTISADFDIFVDELKVTVRSEQERVALRYTTDGSEPGPQAPAVSGPIRLTQTSTVKARAFRKEAAVSPVSAATYTRVAPRVAEPAAGPAPGLMFEYYEGDWDKLPDFDRLRPAKTGPVAGFDLRPRNRDDRFAFRYQGFVSAPRTGVYRFCTLSDDGSRLYIGDRLVVDNDGLHGMHERCGAVALAAGAHPVTVTFFEKTGNEGLEVWYEGPRVVKQKVPATALSCQPALHAPSTAAPDVPTPEARQFAWQEQELIAFVHFGMDTFTDREWGEGTEAPGLFNPTQLDARQWVRVLKAAGMKQVILTAKHHDGFCLWPSRFTEHSVKNSPWRGGQGDVVRDVADACREEGLRFGVYLSPWDRHEPTYGDSPRYNEFYKNQLTELLTNYGPVHEVWFDGACGEGPNGKRQVYDWAGYVDVVRRHAPEAVIFSDAGPDVRWVGNERGCAGETNWSTLRRDEFQPGTPNFAELTAGHEDGRHWVPAECDVSIRPGWFYHAREDDKVKTVAELVDIYYKSVGRNGVLLLNVPADRRGLIHATDAARLTEFRAVLDGTFKTDLAAGKPVEIQAEPVAAAPPGAPRTTLSVDLGTPTVFDRICLQEDIRTGQRVRSFVVDVWSGGSWKAVAEGTTIGYKRLLRVPAVEATQVRVIIRDARGTPAISKIGLYRAAAGEAGGDTSASATQSRSDR